MSITNKECPSDLRNKDNLVLKRMNMAVMSDSRNHHKDGTDHKRHKNKVRMDFVAPSQEIPSVPTLIRIFTETPHSISSRLVVYTANSAIWLCLSKSAPRSN